VAVGGEITGRSREMNARRLVRTGRRAGENFEESNHGESQEAEDCR